MEIEKVNVLGVGISVLDQDRAREFLFDAVRNGKRGYVTVTGVHGVSEAQRDPALKDIFNRALLVTPDGMPMVWMGRLQKHPSIRRVYGPDLVLNLCDYSRTNGFSHFFFGGKPGGLRVAGTFSPPFGPLSKEERDTLAKKVSETRPDFFWVGLSTPKQEFFMAQYISMLPDAEIFIGVGAAFDLLTGRVPQAPRWMQRMGLEWLFRLAQEPKRLWRRYLLNNPVFVFRAAKQLLRIRRR